MVGGTTMNADTRADRTSPFGWLADPAKVFALALGVLALRTLALIARDKHYLILDDAFISFRYARNLVDGLGLVFNPGERVEGYTNFLWTVLLALCQALGLDMEAASVLFAFLATAGTILILLLLGMRLVKEVDGSPSWLSALPPLAFAAGGSQARYVVSGMETALFVFLVVLAVYLMVRRVPPVLTGIVFALATLTRPEGILYLAVALLFQALWGEGETVLGRLATASWILGGFLLLFLPFFFWRWSYYGYPLPNTFYAKAGSGWSGPLLQRGFSLFLQAGWQAGVALPLLVAMGGIRSLGRERVWRLFWLAIVATALYMIAVGGDFLFFFGPRFLNPILPFVLLLAARSVVGLGTSEAGRRLLRLAPAHLVAVLLLANACWMTWPARTGDLSFLPVMNECWAELGRWIARNTPRESVIAVGAVGRIPFYSERTTIDMLGLTDVHIAHLDVPLGAGIPGHEKYDTPYVLGRKPDYLVFPRLDSQGRPFLVGWSRYREAIEREYEMIALARMADAPTPWVYETSVWTPDLGKQGYAAALYRRRVPAAGSK